MLSAILVSCSVACFWVDPAEHVERLMLLGMFALCFILSKQTAHNSSAATGTVRLEPQRLRAWSRTAGKAAGGRGAARGGPGGAI